ncbi:hypothetical protein [Enterobacter hormaechei]|uniref:hypothetical protein n=1 Tax=Enterobacter hormaechei TaxID=158836 RepID=UPI001C19A0BE|nr:hypothetical protein [Enterobacter hormaechei]MCU6157790.1 hypothetical protein [Enterobacter hormaechei]HAV1534917.1 hypothetical protein [Enterobacter hormaechei subsp. xiangfangensis]HAV1863234.1 hypothetical protein [Enterobacter hormaechei subsp. xiangfangensis]
MDYKFFVKLFSQERYREDFINGRIYMNPLNYFMQVEDTSDNNVADKHEGVSAWLQPSQNTLTLTLPAIPGTEFTESQTIVLTEKDLAGPIAVKMNWVDNINVFCMTYLHSHGMFSEPIPEDKIDKLNDYYKLPPEAENLGAYYAVVTDVTEFMRRLKYALTRLVDEGVVVDYNCEPVKYFDETTNLQNDQTSLTSLFYKRKSYSHQQEYRIAIDRSSGKGEPFVLDIGHIGDIVRIGKTKDFNSTIRFKFR